MEMYNEIYVVFLPASTTSILQPIDQGVISTFKYYYLINPFCKPIAAIYSDSSGGPGKGQLKSFWEGVTILGAIKNVHDSWEVVEISTLIAIWKKLISTFLDDFKRFKISVEKVTAVVVEIARELKLEVEPEGVTEVPQFHDTNLTGENGFLKLHLLPLKIL